MKQSPDKPTVSVVVPVYRVEEYLPACLDSLLDQSWWRLQVVVVDDGSPDGSGHIADRYARRDPRITVVHTPNRGLGAARNEGVRHATGDYLAFLDSDDVLPRKAYKRMVKTLRETGSDFVTGNAAKWQGENLKPPGWMRRLHAERRTGLRVDDHPEILGDVFAWNKMFRRSFWDEAGLSWPEGTRYEDQPTLTAAYLRGRFDVIPEVVYHWRIRTDGTSLTQQRATLTDIRDRRATKLSSLRLVTDEGSPAVRRVFVDRVLAGDLWNYFKAAPGAPEGWWEELHGMVTEVWGERSLVHSDLPPVRRLLGWLVEQDRREEMVTLVEHLAAHRGKPARVTGEDGRTRLQIPVLDVDTVAPEALLLRPDES